MEPQPAVATDGNKLISQTLPMVQTDTLCLQPFVRLTHPDINVGQMSRVR